MLKEHFPLFTAIYRAYRPHEPEHVVYEVDTNDIEDFSLTFTAAKVEGDEVIGESSTLVLSKDWLIENYKKFAPKDLDISH